VYILIIILKENNMSVPETVFSKPCGAVTARFALSIADVAVNELTVFRNGEKCQTVRQILAEPGYLLIALGGALETLARAVCAVVLLPLLGIAYLIGCACRCETLKKLSAKGALYVTGSVLFSGVAVVDAILCLKNNLFKGPISPTIRQSLNPQKPSETKVVLLESEIIELIGSSTDSSLGPNLNDSDIIEFS
jgi:hypothetical protein